MLCYSRPSYVTSADSKYPGAGILTALKDNLDKKIIQFQYIGTKSGLYINYPATKLTDCETYDPRFRFDIYFFFYIEMFMIGTGEMTSYFVSCRPFYVSSTASIPRDVVVVLEMSASMRGDKLFQAKHAALTVLETLSVQDTVNNSSLVQSSKRACGY